MVFNEVCIHKLPFPPPGIHHEISLLRRREHGESNSDSICLILFPRFSSSLHLSAQDFPLHPRFVDRVSPSSSARRRASGRRRQQAGLSPRRYRLSGRLPAASARPDRLASSAASALVAAHCLFFQRYVFLLRRLQTTTILIILILVFRIVFA